METGTNKGKIKEIPKKQNHIIVERKGAQKQKKKRKKENEIKRNLHNLSTFS